MPGLFDFFSNVGPQATPTPPLQPAATGAPIPDLGAPGTPGIAQQFGDFVGTPEGQRALLGLAARLNQPIQPGQSSSQALFDSLTGTALETLDRKSAAKEAGREADLAERRVASTERQAETSAESLEQKREAFVSGSAQREATLANTKARTQRILNPAQQNKSDLQFATDAIAEDNPDLSKAGRIAKARELVSSRGGFGFRDRVRLQKLKVQAEKAAALADPLLDSASEAKVIQQYDEVLAEFDKTIDTTAQAPAAAPTPATPQLDLVTRAIAEQIIISPQLMTEAQATFGEAAFQAKLEELGVVPTR